MTTPANKIMQTGQWTGSESYRVACSCSDDKCDITAWIDIVPEEDINQVNLSFYVNTISPWYNKSFNRFKAIWSLITNGYVEQEHVMMLDPSTLQSFIDVLEHAKTKVIK